MPATRTPLSGGDAALLSTAAMLLIIAATCGLARRDGVGITEMRGLWELWWLPLSLAGLLVLVWFLARRF